MCVVEKIGENAIRGKLEILLHLQGNFDLEIQSTHILVSTFSCLDLIRQCFKELKG